MKILLAIAALATAILLAIDPNQRPPQIELTSVKPDFPATFVIDKSRHDLTAAKLFFTETANGAESITRDTEGRFFTGTIRGEILLLDFNTNQSTTVARTGGRPLAIQYDPVSRGIYVADASRGLLWVSPQTGEVKILVTESEGLPIGTCNNMDISEEGIVYFTDASQWKPTITKYGFFDTYSAATMQILSGHPNGRVIRYDPATKMTKVILTGLNYANGVALSADESFLLVCETGAAAIRRLYLKGEQAGQWDYFKRALPFYPDNLNRAPDGDFWVASPSTTSPLVNFIHPRLWLKNIVFRLPLSIFPKPKTGAYMFKMAARDGRIVNSVVDTQHPTVQSATEAFEYDGMLYITSVKHSYVAVIPVPYPAYPIAESA